MVAESTRLTFGCMSARNVLFATRVVTTRVTRVLTGRLVITKLEPFSFVVVLVCVALDGAHTLRSFSSTLFFSMWRWRHNPDSQQNACVKSLFASSNHESRFDTARCIIEFESP
jgi:hypothetical protein